MQDGAQAVYAVLGEEVDPLAQLETFTAEVVAVAAREDDAQTRAREPQRVAVDTSDIVDVVVPDGITDERSRALFRVCASARSFAADRLPDGRVQLRIDTREGGRRRRLVDADEWALVARGLARGLERRS